MEIWDKVSSRAKEYSELTAANLSELVKIPSLTGREETALLSIARMLEASGVDQISTDGFGNLIARLGSGPGKLVFDAHVDVVDTGVWTLWTSDPIAGEIKDGEVLGRGAADQKGGAASMITAARILKELCYGGAFSVYFTFTIMEEDCEGQCWKHIIEEDGLVPDYVVITEPTDSGLCRGQRGRMEIDVCFKGRSAHGSAPERGDNAIYKASRAVLDLERLSGRLETDPFLGRGSIAVTMIQSNSPSLCAIPDRSNLHIDRRLTWGETRAGALREVMDIVGGQAQVSIPVSERRTYRGALFSQEQYFPAWKIPESHPLVRAGIETYELLEGRPPHIKKWLFSTNGVVICGEYDIPVIGFGPGSEACAHAPNERVSIDQLVEASAFYALLPYVLDRKGHSTREIKKTHDY